MRQLVGQSQIFLDGQAAHEVGLLEDNAQGLATPIVQVTLGGRRQMFPCYMRLARRRPQRAAKLMKQGGLACATAAQ